jgi:electron transfer flavoprotein beta subunit
MSTAYPIVVCGSIVPDPLQTLEPVASPTGPALKNEMMLPAHCAAVFALDRGCHWL